MWGKKPTKKQLKGLEIGWRRNKGFKKGHIPWNKGLDGYGKGSKLSQRGGTLLACRSGEIKVCVY